MFLRKRRIATFDLTTDIHSHILPGIDDGAQDMETSLALLRGLESLGLKSVWLTPHVKENVFPNTFESVTAAFDKFRQDIAGAGIGLTLNVAAEYYMGPRFLDLLASGAKLLTIKDKYILVEVSMQQEPLFIFETMYEIAGRGYVPILAHPERYKYYYGREDVFAKLRRQGCKFQINLLSVAGYYGRDVRSAAMKLLKSGYYDFTGTDIHNARHLEFLADKSARKVLAEYDFKNELLRIE